jgi:hypothetical protein
MPSTFSTTSPRWTVPLRATFQPIFQATSSAEPEPGGPSLSQAVAGATASRHRPDASGPHTWTASLPTARARWPRTPLSASGCPFPSEQFLRAEQTASVEQAVAASYRSRFGARADAQLGEDVGDVEADRLLTDVELPGQLPVGAALGEQA